MQIDAMVFRNMSNLKNNAYPGRGIVIGKSPDARNLIQIYWIMGRSENSKNRIFVRETSGFVKTEVFDKSKGYSQDDTAHFLS